MIVPVIFAFVILVASAATSQPYFHKGHDLSSPEIFEQNQTTYEDLFQNNATRPAEDILGDGGMDTVRLRLWVNPTPGQYGLPYALDLAKRFVRKVAPAAWPKSLEGLSETIRDYVKPTLLSFEEAGVNISIVSLGNEVSQGMVWPLSKVDVDIVPESFYQSYGPIATFANLKDTQDTLAAKYGMPMQVIKTQCPVSCSGENASAAFSEPSLPISVQGQLEWIHRIIDTLRQTPNGLRNGVHYWEPTWLGLTVEGLSNCTDVIL